MKVLSQKPNLVGRIQSGRERLGNVLHVYIPQHYRLTSPIYATATEATVNSNHMAELMGNRSAHTGKRRRPVWILSEAETRRFDRIGQLMAMGFYL